MVPTSIVRFRRVAPRVPIYSFCSEFFDGRESHGLVTELSETGLRLHRPVESRCVKRLQLEFELPEVDELIWADGEICHERLDDVGQRDDLLSGVMRSSGVRIVGMAKAQRRLVRDYVHYLRNEAGIARDTEWCSYLPGISTPRNLAV